MIINVETDSPQRLDVFLVGRIQDLSRSQIQALIKNGDILLNGKAAKTRSNISLDDVISITIPEKKSEIPQPEDIPLEVLFEDEHIIVVNKEPGLVVHPAAGNESGTLVNALLHQCKGQLAQCAGELRPGIVHRLDKDTSGCIIAAKTDEAHTSLVSQFSERTCTKQYLAITQAPLLRDSDEVFTHIGRHPIDRKKMAVINPPGGKAAITHYRTLFQDPETNTCLVLCDLHTGRTHQIRVHMLHSGAPLIGDPIYSKIARQPVKTGRLMLHAWHLGITHPSTGKKLSFKAPIPKKFEKWTREVPEFLNKQ